LLRGFGSCWVVLTPRVRAVGKSGGEELVLSGSIGRGRERIRPACGFSNVWTKPETQEVDVNVDVSFWMQMYNIDLSTLDSDQGAGIYC
jgi:hypothetical protein